MHIYAGAERTRLGVVEFLIKQDYVSMIEKVDALELLGASFANDKDNYSLELAYSFIKRGMELRFVSLIKEVFMYQFMVEQKRLKTSQY